MNALVSKLSVRLIFKQIKLVTVESCTGGMIGKTLTDLSGSSGWYEGGFITYSNQSKTSLVNVAADLIENCGAVSEEVAESMAKGALQHFPDCVSVAVTGIAGPGGGSDEKPVGTVCIACQYKQESKVRKFAFKGNRDDIRNETVKESIELLLSMKLDKGN